MNVAQRLDGHIVGNLHQRQFSRRLDQPAGAHQCIGGDDLVGAGNLLNPGNNEETNGGLGGNHA